MTTVQVANSATLNVVSAAAVAALREVALQREAVPGAVILLPENLAEAVVEQAVMRTTVSIRHVAVVEAVGDSFLCHKTDKTIKTIVVGTSNGSQPLAVATPD